MSYLLIYLKKSAKAGLKTFPVHIKNILVPHAGTLLGDKALSYAIKIAKLSGATVNILHSVEPIPGPPPLVLAKKQDSKLRKEMEQTAVRGVREEMQKRANYCKSKGINTNCIIVRGRPEDEILKYSKSHHIDLIIMAKRRKIPGIRGLLKLGSVSRKILEISDKPVLILE
ncbi:universal stress protein [Candidatus Nitrosotenuis sp. DW1]|nr:universal stress protein [Candidatus Nitrosotenuis sp. DW1]